MMCERVTRGGLYAIGALLALLAVAPAWAEDEDVPPTSQFFDQYDRNADGSVTQDEFQGGSEVFRLLDKNKDGAISPAELGLPADYRPRKGPPRDAAGPMDAPRRRGDRQAGERMRKYLERMDADKDGKITKDEWQGRPDGFDRLDRNKDGVLDSADAAGGGRGPGVGPGRGPGGAPAGLPQRLKRLDADGNDKISRDEWRGPEDLFDRLDRNQNGEIEPAEVGRRGGRGREITAEQAAERFRALDKDGDGALSEADGLAAEMLERADADGDGAVTLAEFKKAVKQAQGGPREGRGGDGPRGNAGMLRRFDRDQDGKVTRDEFPGSDERFEQMDKDGDGFLTPADFEDGAEKPKGPVTPKRSLIESCDKDGDGKLNRAEFDGTDEEWKRLDANADGWVTKDEVGER